MALFQKSLVGLIINGTPSSMVDAPINDVHQLEELRVYVKPGAVKSLLKIFLSLKSQFPLVRPHSCSWAKP